MTTKVISVQPGTEEEFLSSVSATTEKLDKDNRSCCHETCCFCNCGHRRCQRCKKNREECCDDLGSCDCCSDNFWLGYWMGRSSRRQDDGDNDCDGCCDGDNDCDGCDGCDGC